MSGYLAFLLVLDAGKNPPGGSSASDTVLIGDRKEIALFHVQLGVLRDGLLDVVNHVFEALSLLGELGHVDQLFPGSHEAGDQNIILNFKIWGELAINP